MKKFLSLLIAAFIITAVLPLSNAAELAVFTEPAGVSAVNTGTDVIYSFGFGAPDAVKYEEVRKKTYDEAKKQYTDAEIAGSSETDWLLCPLEMMCYVRTAEAESVPVKTVNVTEKKAELSLFEDILPALVKKDVYTEKTQDGFDFEIYAGLVLNINGKYSDVPDSKAAVNGVCRAPATAYIEYDLPLDADNKSNPVFLFYPFEKDIELKNPERAGYIFTGWVNERGEAIDRIPANTQHIKIGAGWSSAVHKINYVLTTRSDYSFIRCKNSNPGNFSSDSGLSLLAPSAPYGWVFGGWFETPGFDGEAITVIPVGTAHDVILYARWLTAEEALDERLAAEKWGDLNSDGSITAADARIALRASVGLETLQPDILSRADFASQGKLTSAHARFLLRIAVGLDSLKDVLKLYGRI